MMSVLFRSYPDSIHDNPQQDIKTTVYRSSIFAFQAYHIARITSKDVRIFQICLLGFGPKNCAESLQSCSLANWAALASIPMISPLTEQRLT